MLLTLMKCSKNDKWWENKGQDGKEGWMPGTCIPLGAGGGQLVHRPQSKLPALGIALCGEVADWYPLARLVSSASFPGVENPDLATGMPRSATNPDDFARSPVLVEAKVANLRPDWCSTGNTRHIRNQRDRNAHDLVCHGGNGRKLLTGRGKSRCWCR